MSGDQPLVVVVDDDPWILEAWGEALAGHFQVELFSDPLAAQRFFGERDIDVAVLDIRMPGLDGLSLLRGLRERQPRAEVIVITGHGTIQTAVDALQMGAYDFLCKPVEDLDAAVRRIESAVERKQLRELNANLKSRLAAFGPSTNLIGESRGVAAVRELIDQISDSTAPVLIHGESGTGKELAARALHLRGPRRDAPFIAINCAAVSETLMDSELFGHERGAFTGATSAHKGLFEAAHGGILFLDEIGDVPLQSQVKLLRVLQEGEVRPVGSTQARRVDVRVLVATNVDLERAMGEGRFREDLFYRISTFRLSIPPLRERREDIPLLAQHLLDKINWRRGQRSDRQRSDQRQVTGFTDEALATLVVYDWPGNVRELGNAIEHAATLCSGDQVDSVDLPNFVIGPAAGSLQRDRPAVGSVASRPFSEARTQLIEEFERRYLSDLLAGTEGNMSEAARRSGIDRSNLRRMLKRHQLNANSFKPSG